MCLKFTTLNKRMLLKPDTNIQLYMYSEHVTDIGVNI